MNTIADLPCAGWRPGAGQRRAGRRRRTGRRRRSTSRSLPRKISPRDNKFQNDDFGCLLFFFYTSESPQRQSPKYGYLVQSKADYFGLDPVFGIFKLLIIILILFLLFLAWSFLPVIALS